MKPTEYEELDKNQAAYDEIREKMEAEHLGGIVLMHDGEVIDVYNDGGDAYKIACEKYGLGNFSLITVGEQPIRLGGLTMSLISDTEQ